MYDYIKQHENNNTNQSKIKRETERERMLSCAASNDHSNDRYQNIRLRLTGNLFSHRQLHCGIIYQKTYSEQNQLVR